VLGAVSFTGPIQESQLAADFSGVPAAQFAHVLDRLIGHGPGPSSTVDAAGILTTPLLAAPLAHGYAASLFRTAPQPRLERPRRRLSAGQQDALDILRHAGAYDLRSDYFASELKAAFRRLARQLHPDRHPGADGATRARLASAFHQVREAYRALSL